MILQDRVIKGLCDFIEELLHISTLSSFVAIDFVVVVYKDLYCHVILQNHMNIWSCDFMGKNRSI